MKDEDVATVQLICSGQSVNIAPSWAELDQQLHVDIQADLADAE